MPDNSVEELVRLEQRVEELLRLCERLRVENYALRESQAQLNTDRATLQEKNDLARAQIEAIISRLKAMEHD